MNTLAGYPAPNVSLSLIAQSGVTRIWIWGAVLIVAAVGAFFAIMAIRRRFVDGGESKSMPWTLQELKDLHAAGEISDEEYRALREQVIGSVGVRPGKDDAGSD